MKIIIVDDHPLILEGIAGILRQAGHTIVGTCANGNELRRRLLNAQPDVITLDIGLPGDNGIDVARQVLSQHTKAKIVIVSQQTGPVYVRSALQAGASGFVAKQSSSRELLVALDAVASGRTYVSPGLLDGERGVEDTTAPVVSGKRSGLTQRQRDVLQLVAEGKTAKEAALALNISVKTIEFHKQALMRGLNLRTTAELTRYAIAEGLCPLQR